MMEHLLISACLLGAQCRYDGQSKPVLEMVALSEQFDLVPVCPEQLGGLPTPRDPSERLGGAVVTKQGADVTGKRILLMDDIVTTGATLSECARVLGKAGAEQVVCATVARSAD